MTQSGRRAEKHDAMLQSVFCWLMEPQSASLAPDVRRLDDWPPLLDVGLQQCAEHSRRLLVAGGHLISQVGELLNNARVGQRAHYCTIKLINDILRCAPGRENPIPARHRESGETRLTRCWNVGRC